MLTGLSGQTIVPNKPSRTFDWGETGQIEMRPFEEASRAMFNTPSTQQVDNTPIGLLQQQHKQALEDLDRQFIQGQNLITQDSKYAANSVKNEFTIKLGAFAKKYNLSASEIANRRINPGKYPPEELNKIKNEFNNLDTQYALAIQKISDKIQPDLDSLEMAKQEETKKLQQNMQLKQFRIGVIQDLVNKGVIQNPAAAMQEQYQILGINMPLSAFQEKVRTPRQELSDVRMAINALKDQIPKETKYVEDEFGNKTMVRKGEMSPELQQQIAELEEMERQLLPQVFPQYIKSSTQVKPLSRAATRALIGDGQQGGTLAGRVMAAKKQQEVSAKEILQQLKAQGLSKEEAINWMKANGY